EALRKKYGRGVVPLQIPVGEEKGFRGTVDLIRMEGHLTENGERKGGPIPQELAGRVAEGDDTLMERFFAQGTLEESDLLPGLQKEVAARKIFPVLCASSSLGIGVRRVLDARVQLLPSPAGTL